MLLTTMLVTTRATKSEPLAAHRLAWRVLVWGAVLSATVWSLLKAVIRLDQYS